MMDTQMRPQTETREEIIRQWYEEVFPKAAAYIRRRGGTLTDAREVFQESLVLYYEKRADGCFEPKSDDQAYLMGIVKNRWLRYREVASRQQDLACVEVAQEKQPQPIAAQLLRALKQAGEKCLQLLQSYYYEKLTMKQLAERFGYAGERSATVQKYKCIEKVRDEIKQKSLSYEDFLD